MRAGGWALAVWQTPRARIGQIGSCRTALVLALFATLSVGNAFSALTLASWVYVLVRLMPWLGARGYAVMSSEAASFLDSRDSVRTPRRQAVPILATAVWLWAVAIPASTAAEAEWRIHARGLGRLTVGMTLAEARQLPGIQLEALGPPPVPANYCTYFRVRLAAQEFRVRVMGELVDRLEVSSPGFRTLTGVGVGDSIDRVKEAYGGRIEVEPHHYLWDQGYVLMVLGPYAISGDAYGVAFVASPSKGITEIRAGKYANIRESEGCT